MKIITKKPFRYPLAYALVCQHQTQAAGSPPSLAGSPASLAGSPASFARRVFPLTLFFTLLIFSSISIIGCTTETVSPRYNNIRPEIILFETLPDDSIEVQDTLVLECEADDPEGQPLSYFWHAESGTILSDSTVTTRWVAPRVPGSYWINLTVSDPFSDTTASRLAIVLPRGATNRAPEIVQITTVPDTVTAGEIVNCAVQATDEEEDALSYIWTAQAGEFDRSFGSQVHWAAPAELGEYYIKVAVTDGNHSISDSLSVLVAADTVTLYDADFTIDQVSGAWGSIGLLAGLGDSEGINQIEWDSTTHAMSVTSKTTYGTYGFRLIGRNFGPGTFYCTVKVLNGEYHRIAFVPKLIDRQNYVIFGIDPYVGSWQVLRCTAGTMQYLSEGWNTFDLNNPLRFEYKESNNRATASINGQMLWSGAVAPEFQRSAPMGVALYGTNQSGPALFDNFMISTP